jgi:anti-anti-sigma regulatory factor
VLLATPLEESQGLATSIVRYVARTGEPIVVPDAASEPRFASDPYIERERPKSILCVPMMRQGRLMGVLYLENNATPNAFTQARREVSELLASQAAIAIDNALLYAHVEHVSAQLRQANERLEGDVARSAEELRERKRGEAERAALQEEVIRLQREMLLELSTPLIPITDRVMVMPLIGTMDAKRAEQVLETALRGAAAGQAEIVILDLTGLKGIDAEVVGKLTRMAGGLRLLGTGVVISGVRPEMARMLVEMDVTLQGIVTCGTLQSGIAYALRRKA